MKLEKIIGGNYPIHGRCFERNSIACHLPDGKIIVASPRQAKSAHVMGVYLYMPNKKQWICGTMDNDCTVAIHRYYKDIMPKKPARKVNYAGMMQHDRRHKGGGGGSRDFVSAITDYECSSHPLHDFRRVYN